MRWPSNRPARPASPNVEAALNACAAQAAPSSPLPESRKARPPMFQKSLAALAVALAFAGAAQAQNIAIVNGKPVPKVRADELMKQATRGGQQPATPEMEARVREEVVVREIFAQEAERKGLAASPTVRTQMEIVRQQLIIRELFTDYLKKNPVTDAEAKAEYDKYKAQAGGGGNTEYRARHILVEKEDEARALLVQLKGGAKFEDLAKKHSKDTGSATNGGELDFAKPDAYVPEFGQAMASLKKGQLTTDPVKTQFGFHIIKLEDTREAKFPEFEEVKPQLTQQMEQRKLQAYQESLRKSAKTDFKFTQ
jgi:peptidyl-prolyl cis-trans isomerase C